jgi:hypothetical protein
MPLRELIGGENNTLDKAARWTDEHFDVTIPENVITEERAE